MSHINNSVRRLIKKHKTKCPYELAEHLGIEIFEYAFRKIRGLIFHLDGRKIIGVKAGLPEYLKRAIIAHEIGHEELHPVNVGYFFIKEHTNFVPGRYEREANLFAAMLLVDEHPEYGETVEEYAARIRVPPELVKVYMRD